MLDVLVTQHAKWTANRLRRGLFGQSLVDFSTESWSSIQLKEAAEGNASEQDRALPKKTPRILRGFAPSRVAGGKKQKSQPLVPGMSQYSDSQDVDMDAGNADPSSLSFSTNAAWQAKLPNVKGGVRSAKGVFKCQLCFFFRQSLETRLFFG